VSRPRRFCGAGGFVGDRYGQNMQKPSAIFMRKINNIIGFTEKSLLKLVKK
jgi:hypothetical protein